MAKVRVPERLRPPDRFKPTAYWNNPKKLFIPSGKFGCPKEGEFFYDPDALGAIVAHFDFECEKYVIMIPADAMIAEDKKAGEAQS